MYTHVYVCVCICIHIYIYIYIYTYPGVLKAEPCRLRDPVARFHPASLATDGALVALVARTATYTYNVLLGLRDFWRPSGA